MDDPREYRLRQLSDVEQRSRERERLIAELVAEYGSTRGYRLKLARLSGLSPGRISQIVGKTKEEKPMA